LITDDGTIIRMPVSDISVIGRVAQGVRVMRVAEESRIVGVTVTEREEEVAAEELEEAETTAFTPEEAE
ncbi:DNA gyrase C-terminal beta-propeller domain-containing protein, partial [Fibrobacter sp.]|uniref:DNA gyrase C-terminal beta-propeller domain-containing protein n=1 Tax=Fibrobacter sp. TaxID=35828 RepID=UPI0025C522B4